MSKHIEGKKKNLLGSGKLHHEITNEKKFREAVEENCLEKNNFSKGEHNGIKEVSISNFPRLIKNSKKNKSNKKILTGKTKLFTNQNVIKTENNLSGFNQGSFFPYRKSFLCYWLLPFVGFVSSATLSLGKQPIKDYNLYKSNTFETSDLLMNVKPKGQLINHQNLLINSEFINNSLNQKDTNDFLPDYAFKESNSLSKLGAKEIKGQVSSKRLEIKENSSAKMQTNKNNMYTESKTEKNHVGKPNLEYGSVATLWQQSALNAQTYGHRESSSLHPSTSNSLKYCMLYLDCLENDLNFLEKTGKNAFCISSLLEHSNNLQKSTFGLRTSAFYPNSFFNRILLCNESFDRFWSEPLKINFNVPLQNSNNYMGNNLFNEWSKENSQSEFSRAVEDKKQSGAENSRNKRSEKINLGVGEDCIRFVEFSKFLNKNNPVTSFLRASTLLDKYILYKPIVQDLIPKNGLSSTTQQTNNNLQQNINVQPELIDKLFSYFSKESTYAPSRKSINENVYLKSLNKNQKENLSPNFNDTFMNNLSPSAKATDKSSRKKITIIFEKLSSLERKEKFSQNISIFSKQQAKYKANEFNHKIYDKISKNKLYNVVLLNLKESLTKSNFLLDLFSNGRLKEKAGDSAKDTISALEAQNDNKLNSTDSIRTIKFKHPILISNKSSYPLLTSKNKSKSLMEKIELEDLKNKFPLMLQNVSPIFKEKRPLENKFNHSFKNENYSETPEYKNKQKNLHSKENKKSPRNILFSSAEMNKKYFQLKTYINKYTRYALKDFLILNKISTYIQPIPQEFSIKTDAQSGFKASSPSVVKKDILPLDSIIYSKHGDVIHPQHGITFSGSSLDRKKSNLVGHSFASSIRESGTRVEDARTNGTDTKINIYSPYVLEEKENLLQKDIDRPNENLILTKESSSKVRKIRQNDKTAKLLRAYFSIKKSSKKNVYGTSKKAISSNRLKHKIILNLVSKSYAQYPSFSKQIKTINNNRYVYPLKIKKGLNFLSTQLHKTNNNNNIKELTISPRLLLNNRLLLKIKTEKNSTSKTLKNKFIPNEEVIRKRKTIQKKRRITKLKKETRRRKKRMRFYPRPIWLRYRFYSQFLKNRRHMKNKKMKFTSGENNRSEFYNILGSSLNLNSIKENFYNHRSAEMNKNIKKPKKVHKVNFLKNVFEANSYKLFPYNAAHSTVNVSPSLMGEFKTAFWKSYWLRSNLKPYFNKIKTSLKDIKETPKCSTNIEPSFKQTYLLDNVRNFILSFLGLNNNYNTTITESSKDYTTPLHLHSLSKKDIESYYKTANYLAEYNEISSKRIQQFVSQIRENLTLNGHVKVRPSRISINFGSKGSKKHGINFLKRPTLRYNAMSRLRLYWAFSKGTTNLAGLGTTSLLPGAETVNGNNYNKRKQIWTTEKFRQQTKENKTKKLLKDIKTKLQVLVNETPYISLEKNIPLWNNLILKSIKKIRIQEEKLQNLAFVNLKTNSRIFSSNSLPKSKTISLRPLNIRKNRFKNSFKRTAKVQPFISGKTNYWWNYSHNSPFSGVNSFLSTPINYTNNLMHVSGPFRQDNIFNSQIKKGWSYFHNIPSHMGMESNIYVRNPDVLQINTILFHFCSLVTLLSISQIRGLLKFSFIGVNKIFTLLERLIPSYLFNIPFKSSRSIKDNSSNKYNLNRGIDLGLNVLYKKESPRKMPYSTDESPRENPRGNLNSPNNRKLSNVKILSSNKEEQSSDVTLQKNKFTSEFNFEKRNNSFLYSFYLNKNNNYYYKDIKSNLFMGDQKIANGLDTSVYFNPRLHHLEKQNKESYNKDYQNFYIKPTVNNLFLSEEKSLLPFLSITAVYYFLNNLIKKPIYLYYKLFSLYSTVNYFKKEERDEKNEKNEKNIGIDLGADSSDQTKNEEKWKFTSRDNSKQNNVTTLSGPTQINNGSIIYINMYMYSLLFIRFGFSNFMLLSKNLSNLLGQRAKLEGAFRSIYTFFEKPGVLIVDWVAYLFLVEWASDITNTLPENVDTQIAGSPFNKLTRTIYTIYPFLPLMTDTVALQGFMNQVTLKGVADNESYIWRTFNTGLTSKTTFLSLASTFLKRRIYHLYEILVLQFYQPDTDLLVRQKKGIVFWDIWGDFLTQTAEDSNVNISELTSLKEEQMKLLENASDNISRDSLFKKSQFSNVNTKNSISSTSGSTEGREPEQKIYSKISSLTPLKSLLSEKEGLRPYNKQNKQNKKNKSSIISSVKPFTDSLEMSAMPLTGRFQNIDNGLHQWGSQQFLSYAIKSKDTELFIDLHPPRALASVLKNKESSQQLRAISPMGSLVCQIFAGILYKQISKNILIVGNTKQTNKNNDSSSLLNDASASLEKTLLVQAIAGETELKIITDNAYRYALVYRGVAVGIKLLRDVFDSLSLQTPCFFLIEDIHAIGERRPFLISDDTPEGNTEIHEKNQVLYQLSKHVISHYKKPYKGDFSLSIPTNHFCFDFFKKRNTNSIGKASISRQNTISPKIYHNPNSDMEEQKEGPRILSSRLLRPSTELLSPPATSPFSVLTLKEEKKLKTHKKVSDLPWTGKITPQGDSTSSQDSQKTGPAYSIRAKVALLADIAISSLSVKLDMITDLLVIIDSVKGNRGFVVFATTHIPFVLDPALRRPGRLDETISFGFSSKNHSPANSIVSHFGILNVPRHTYLQTSPQSKYTSVSNTYASLGRRGGSSLDFSLTSTAVDTNTILGRLCQKAVHPFSTSSHLYLKRTSSLFHFFPENLFNESSRTKENSVLTGSNLEDKFNYSSPKRETELSNIFAKKDNLLSHTSNRNYPKTTKILSQVATKASAYLNASIKCFDDESKDKDERHLDLHIKNALTQLPDVSLQSPLSNSSHLSMYVSPHFFKNNISLLISGKIGEFLLFSKTSQLELNRSNNFEEVHSSSYKFIPKSYSVSATRRSSLMPVVTESISSLVLSFIQKRFLYKSNLMLPTLFNFINFSSLMEPSSPPISSILLPAKRYENLKRSLSYYQKHDQNFGSGIMEKINTHQQQRLVKRLYNIPVKESFKSEIIANRLSTFSNASLMVGSISPSALQKISSSNWFVRNRIFSRHSLYLTNQWWNGQLPEHNAETTFLSDIDWRYAFVEREARDILLDFPDADQHYNPRNRRWVGNTNWEVGTISTPSLTNSQNSFYSEIYSHFIYDSFLKAFNIYEQNREAFDFYSFYICKQGLNAHLHEFERLKLIQRFLNN